MKILKWIALCVGFVVIALWVVKKFRSAQGRPDPGARDADDVAANKQSNEREKQSLYYTPKVGIPMAQWVRPNGAIVDLNKLGGTIPDMVTIPEFRTLSGSFGYGN